jgi:hypothetical protein
MQFISHLTGKNYIKINLSLIELLAIQANVIVLLSKSQLLSFR